MDINVIGVPLHYGCDRDGAQLGPATLRANEIIDIIKNNGHEVHDMGDIYIPFVSAENKFSDHPKMKYLNVIADINSNLANNVYYIGNKPDKEMLTTYEDLIYKVATTYCKYITKDAMYYEIRRRLL